MSFVIIRSTALALSLGFLLVLPCQRTAAATPELVGVTELLLTEDAAKALALSDKQLEQLNALSDKRELDGIDAAMAVSQLPAEEQRQKLAPYRLESERKALAILSETQRAKLPALIEKSNNPLYDPVDTILSDKPAAPPKPAAKPQPTEKMPEPVVPESKPSAKNDTSDPVPSTPAAEPPTATPPAIEPTEKPVPVGDGKLTFNFRFQPWEEVLDWFAEQSDLSLILDAPPSGTFNYRDNRRYSVGEAMDVLNNVLQTKGYTLVRKDRMLMLVNLEDEIPPNLVTDVPLEDLKEHGEHELIRVLFRVRSMLPEELSGELEKLIGPQGKIIVLSKANMIQVTETAGRIRTIKRVIDSIDGPSDGDIRELALTHVMVEEALPIIRQMLGIPSDALATPAGTLQLAIDPVGGKIFARGDAKEIARVEEVLRLVDVEGSALSGAATAETPQVEVYSTGGADPKLVVRVMQTLLAGSPGVRLEADEATGSLVALARPTEHATIRATLAQMQQDSRQVEVIALDRLDPAVAKLAVDKLFNTGTEEKPDPRAPIVEADLNSYSLIVRATPSQLTDIKGLLDQLGESGAGGLADGGRSNVRVIPLTGSAARSALAQVQQIWPVLRKNKIRIVTPSATAPIQEFRPSDPSGGAARDENATPVPYQYEREMNELLRSLEQSEMAPRRPPSPPADPSAKLGRGSPFRFVSQPAEQRIELKSKSGATIIVAAGPGGLLIASEDTEALDEFEDLLRSTSGQSSTGRQFAVFYLKYAEASAASEILASIFGGGAGGGGSLAGDIAGGVLNEVGGGMMGDLLGLGMGGGSSAGFDSASVDIVPDMRLNALIVYATPKDLDTVEQLLRVVDQRTGPAAVEAGGKPRLIPVKNTSATAVAEVVKQVYQDRLQGAGAGAQPSPRDIMRMLQRGRGGGGGGGGTDQEPSKMTVGIDARSNSLIVRAPDPLFEEVKLLVKQLDEEGLETPQATRVVTLQHTNAEAVKEALESLLGSDAITSTTQQSGNRAGNNQSGRGNQNNSARETQRRIEFFRQLQQRGGGGRGGARGGRGSRGGAPTRGGGGGRGGRGGGRGR